METAPADPVPGLTREEALDKVRPPAIALIVFASLGIALAILGILINMLGLSLGATESVADEEAWTAIASGSVGLVQGAVALAMGVLIVACALKMMKLEAWNAALAAAIVAIVPCLSPCCLLGLPVGIWALVILADPEVKAHFTSA